MAAGSEREVLAEVGDRLCAELGYTGGAVVEETEATSSNAAIYARVLSPADERLVAAARQSLGQIAAAVSELRPPVLSETVRRALLDGAELMMRGELAAGKPISPLMPSFVYLIALPSVTRDEALKLSRRTAELLDEALG